MTLYQLFLRYKDSSGISLSKKFSMITNKLFRDSYDPTAAGGKHIVYDLRIEFFFAASNYEFTRFVQKVAKFFIFYRFHQKLRPHRKQLRQNKQQKNSSFIALRYIFWLDTISTSDKLCDPKVPKLKLH